MSKLTINADRYSLDIVRSGQSVPWEYDVLTLKLEADRLEKLHKLRDEKTVKAPTAEFLIDFATFLILQGLDGCSIDTAFRVYSLVTVQFSQIARGIAVQVAELATTK